MTGKTLNHLVNVKSAEIRKRNQSSVHHKRHPLHDMVVEIMKRDRCQDATKLGMALSGGGLSGKGGVSGNRAYRLVAGDVLGCMYEQGYLDRDEFGWYVLATTSGGEVR
jgi:hypothetical protein